MIKGIVNLQKAPRTLSAQQKPVLQHQVDAADLAIPGYEKVMEWYNGNSCEDSWHLMKKYPKAWKELLKQNI